MSEPPELNNIDLALNELTWNKTTRLALQLGVPHWTLKQIEENYSNASRRRIEAMSEWLQMEVNTSWAKIASALKTIDMPALATKVEQQHCQSAESTPAMSTTPQTPTPSLSTSSTVASFSPASNLTTAVELSPSPLSPESTMKNEPLSPVTSAVFTSPPTQPLHPTSRPRTPSPLSAPTSSPPGPPSASPMPSGLQHTPTDATQSRDLPGQQRKARIKSEALQLQDKFVSVLTATKIHFSEEEMKSKKFLNRFRITLTTLPLSAKFKRLHYLHEERKALKNAKDVDDVFEVLDRYWNWLNYGLLKKLITDFGDATLQQKMTEYLTELEMFEKSTSVLDVKSAEWYTGICPFNFCEVEIILQRDASKVTLYDIRMLRQEIAGEALLESSALYMQDVHASSVVVILAFPSDALELLPPALSSQFLATHHITSVTLDNKPLQEYTEEYVKVSRVVQCFPND